MQALKEIALGLKEQVQQSHPAAVFGYALFWGFCIGVAFLTP